MTIDYGQSLKFAFEDEDWLKKLGKAALWTFISMLLLIFPLYFFGLGYGLETARNVLNGKEKPLPELDDVGATFKDGAKFFVVTLVYGSPIIILYCVIFGIAIAAGASDGLDEEAMGAAMGGGMLAVQCLLYVFAFALALLLPAIMTLYLRTNDIRASLNVSEVIAITRDNLGTCFMMLLMYIAASFIFQIVFLLSFITICGWIFVYFAGIPWVAAVQGHLVGQFVGQLDSPENKLDPVAFE